MAERFVISVGQKEQRLLIRVAEAEELQGPGVNGNIEDSGEWAFGDEISFEEP